MSFTPVDHGATERIWYTARDSAGAVLSGVTDLRVAVMRSDGLFLDWSDGAFKAASSATTLRQTLAEVDATNVPGVYTAQTPVLSDGKYLLYVDQSLGSSVAGLPGVTELRVGQEASVWAVAEGTPAVGTHGYGSKLSRQMITNRNEVDETDNGRERLWDDDGTTVIKTWPVRDGAGGAIINPPGSPARRGAAT